MDAIDIFLYIGYGLLIVSVLAILVLSAFNLVKEPKAMVKTGIVLVSFVVLFFICYSMSDNIVTTKYAALGVGAGSSKLIGGALISMYIVLLGAVAVVVYNEASKIFK